MIIVNGVIHKFNVQNKIKNKKKFINSFRQSEEPIIKIVLILEDFSDWRKIQWMTGLITRELWNSFIFLDIIITPSLYDPTPLELENLKNKHIVGINVFECSNKNILLK